MLRLGAVLCLLLFLLPVPDASAGWRSRSEKELTAEADAFVKNKPEALQPFFHTLYMEGEWNAVLNFNLLALAALEVNRPDIAEIALDESTQRIQAVFSTDPPAQVVRRQWAALDPRDFRGEPYERAMAFLYRGLLYLRGGDADAARAAFLQAAQQSILGEGENYDPSFSLPVYLAAWVANCQGDGVRSAELMASLQKGAVDPFFQNLPAAMPRHITLIDRGLGPRKVITGESRTTLRFLPRADITGPVQIHYGNLPVDVPVRAVAANLDWLALTRGGRRVQGIVDGKAQFAQAPAEGPVPDAAFYASLSALGSDNAAIARSLGLSGNRSTLLGAAASASPRGGKIEADTRSWGSLPKLLYIEAFAGDFGLEMGDFSTLATRKPRPMLLSAKIKDQCSLAYGREYSALDPTQGGVGNPSPWPASPLEDDRDKVNEEMRIKLRKKF